MNERTDGQTRVGFRGGEGGGGGAAVPVVSRYCEKPLSLPPPSTELLDSTAPPPALIGSIILPHAAPVYRDTTTSEMQRPEIQLLLQEVVGRQA